MELVILFEFSVIPIYNKNEYMNGSLYYMAYVVLTIIFGSVQNEPSLQIEFINVGRTIENPVIHKPLWNCFYS